jgi:hypothetical protein
VCLLRLPRPRRRPHRPHRRRHHPCPRSPEVPCVRAHRHTTSALVLVVATECLAAAATTHILKPRDSLVDVARRVLVQLLVVTEDDDCDVDGAQHGKLVRLLEQTTFALEEGDRPGR